MASKRKPALSTQLKSALHTVDMLQANIEAVKAEAQKKVDSANSSRDHERAERIKAQAELEQIHAFLDAVPNAPTRETQIGDYGQKTIHSAMTRLSVFLATRSA